MSIPRESYTNYDRKGCSLSRFPVDVQKKRGYDYKQMRDIYDLVRNGRGDRFFEEGTVPQDLYYITPQGHALKRMGPKGENPNYPDRRSLFRIGFIPDGYCHVNVQVGGISQQKKIHHLVYAAFGDVNNWSTGRLDHLDGSKTNNDIHNLRPSTDKSDSVSRQRRFHTPIRNGGGVMRNNTSGYTGLRYDATNTRFTIKIIRDYKELVREQFRWPQEDDEGWQQARDRLRIHRRNILGLLSEDEDGEDEENENGEDGAADDDDDEEEDVGDDDDDDDEDDEEDAEEDEEDEKDDQDEEEEENVYEDQDNETGEQGRSENEYGDQGLDSDEGVHQGGGSGGEGNRGGSGDSTGGGGGGKHTLYWRDKHFRTLRNRLIGQKVIKQFPGFGDFEGTVTQYGIDTDNYTVLYDDGDEETMTYQDLCDLDITPRKSRKRKRSGGTRGKKERASRVRRLHRERDNEVLHDDGDEETVTYQDLCDLDITPKKSRKRKRSGGTRGKKERASRVRRLHRERDDEVKSTRWGLGFRV